MGIVIGVGPSAFVLWVHHQYTSGISGHGAVALVVLALAGIGCLGVSYRLLRGRHAGMQ